MPPHVAHTNEGSGLLGRYLYNTLEGVYLFPPITARYAFKCLVCGETTIDTSYRAGTPFCPHTQDSEGWVGCVEEHWFELSSYTGSAPFA